MNIEVIIFLVSAGVGTLVGLIIFKRRNRIAEEKRIM